MRKLASVQRVVSVDPIPNADAIELARVLGWQCVVKKGEVKPGDLVVYFEIDSKLPARHEFAFMADRGYRVRTIKLRGCISQGLAMPVATFPELGNVKEGQDVTEKLAVVKYQKGYCGKPGSHKPRPRPGLWLRLWNRFLVLIGKRDPGTGTFPSFLRKTDEPRIQGQPSFLEKHRGDVFYVTEKLDGCSITAFVKDGKFGMCSRNTMVEANQFYSDLRKFFHPTAKALFLEHNLRNLKRNIAIQGELIGPEIQGNKYGLREHKLFLFNVFDIDKQEYLSMAEAFEVARRLSLQWCPVLDTSLVLNHSVDEIVKLSTAKSKLAKVQREGIVVRSVVEQFDPNHGRCSFKVINPEFLLKYEDQDVEDEQDEAAE